MKRTGKTPSPTEKRGYAKVLVAYNRRFYASTLAAERIIREQGGADSALFEFTEWLHTFKDSGHDPSVKKTILMANSSHVLDLFIHLCGRPTEMSCYTKGEPGWYGEAHAFTGAGKTERGALFAYSTNWTGPGRWSLEIIAGTRRLIFRPMEQLHIQETGSLKIERADIDDALDTAFKPGLYLQTQAFLNGTHRDKLLTIADQLIHAKLYARIAGLTTE